MMDVEPAGAESTHIYIDLSVARQVKLAPCAYCGSRKDVQVVITETGLFPSCKVCVDDFQRRHNLARSE